MSGMYYHYPSIQQLQLCIWHSIFALSVVDVLHLSSMALLDPAEAAFILFIMQCTAR